MRAQPRSDSLRTGSERWRRTYSESLAASLRARTVEAVVAEGGFGVVYRAHHGGFRAPVALKLLKIPPQGSEQQAAFLELFRAEAELLFRLSASLQAVVRPLHVDAFHGRSTTAPASCRTSCSFRVAREA